MEHRTYKRTVSHSSAQASS